MKRILGTYALLFVVVLILAWCATAHCQVSPFAGVGSVQWFDNNGKPLTAGVLYVFQAGTSTFVPVYTDSTGATQLPNPVPFGAGARSTIWLTSGTFVKLILCLQNDGPACAGSDVLSSVDQVPIGSSGGGGGGSPFTGTFISASATPATTGILRLASGDSICWRNAAGSSNLCISKDPNDLLTWAGGVLKLAEVAAPGCVVGFDLLWADSSHHALWTCGNGNAAVQVAYSGFDINQSSNVISWHFGSTATPLSSTAPNTGQNLYWNGTNIAGNPNVVTSVDRTALSANIGLTTLVTPSANGFFLVQCYTVVTRAATTSSTLPQCNLNWNDADSGVGVSSFITGTNSANTVGFTQGGANFISGVPGYISIYAQSGQPIQYWTNGYLTSGATTMQYAIHIRIEGPF